MSLSERERSANGDHSHQGQDGAKMGQTSALRPTLHGGFPYMTSAQKGGGGPNTSPNLWTNSTFILRTDRGERVIISKILVDFMYGCLLKTLIQSTTIHSLTPTKERWEGVRVRIASFLSLRKASQVHKSVNKFFLEIFCPVEHAYCIKGCVNLSPSFPLLFCSLRRGARGAQPSS